jgi:DNA-binding PadR family transcriptional regulator
MTSRALQEASLLVLTALADGSRHGYGIITEVNEISGGRVKLRAGTLYAALDRLRAAGLIGIDREEIVGSRPRRYYRLTPAGGRRPAAERATRHHRPRETDLRIGDADRETAVTALREHFAQGRLTLEELIARLDAALTATRQSQITQTTRDLPQL